jgi:hypothetical protein
MNLTYVKNWYSCVRRINPDDVLAETFLNGTDIEAAGRLTVNVRTFAVKEAAWEVYRSPGGRFNGCKAVPALKGAVAYFNIGKELRRAVGDEAGGMAREMLAECVRGMIQAETFLYRERGFESVDDYGRYWESHYLNSCRYYSNLDRVTRAWPEYVGNFWRGLNFFTRSKSCSVFSGSDGLNIVGNLSDSFHEMGAVIDLDTTGRVAGCRCGFLRAPDRVCFECEALFSELKGLVLPHCGKKQIGKVIGGGQGCDHLVDLISDMAKAVAVVWKSKAGLQELK